jgi:hypothetical protein
VVVSGQLVQEVANSGYYELDGELINMQLVELGRNVHCDHLGKNPSSKLRLQ